MRRPNLDMKVFRDRRAALANMAQGAAIIIPSHPDYLRNNDVSHSYRQDTNFYYLTGFEESESVLVIRPGQTPETVLFVRPKDVVRETWDGFRYGPEGAEKEFGVDQAFLMSEFDQKIVELLKPVNKIYYRWNIDSEFDLKMLSFLERVRVAHGRGWNLLTVSDVNDLLGELRVIKSAHDVSIMRRACEISANAHVEAMKFVRPGVTERQVQGVLLGSFYMQGADREGYGSIVASGANATTLHYVFNDQVCQDGDLLLIDAGAEYQFYTGDITRTFPVNGKFTEPQRRVYDRVLELQKSLCQSVKPGMTIGEFQTRTIDELTQLMLDLKLLSGTHKQCVESAAYRRYYPHGVSHFLGMDVHDAGMYHDEDGQSRVLEPGIAFTIEPGLYIPADDQQAPEELRGIGIRIEDDVVVTASGCEVLTSGVPKDVSEMEEIIGRRN